MKKEKILVACSGGPDSMALLDYYHDKKDICVCHINYHKRKTANRDENIVKRYCKEHKIKFYKFDYKDNKKGNFQKLARDFRYECFKKICLKDGIRCIYVAHHMDDNIETYLMQIKRKSSVDYYGISKKVKINGITVYRPFLNKTKDQLILYLKDRNIEYGIDESNNSNKYERNRIRHSKVEKMSYKQKLEIIKEIEDKNNKLLKEINETNCFIKNYTKYDYNDFISFKYFDRLLRLLLYKKLSLKYIGEIKKALINKTNIELQIKDKVLCKEYGYVYVYSIVKPYRITLDSINTQSFDHFKISLNGNSKSGVFVCDDDFPLTIRNYQIGDKIQLLYGTKKINRFFIDNKISSYDRKIWPVVLNSKGDIILVPGIGCNKTHYSKKYNLYVLKLS